MNIALLTSIEERVPPKKYGGLEYVEYVLAEELVRLGHQVTIFATGDSKLSARVIPIAPKAIGSNLKKCLREALTYQSLVKVAGFLQTQKFDIVHNHIGWKALLFKDIFKHPILTTIHGALDDTLSLEEMCENKMYGMFRDMPFVSISDAQRVPLPDLNYVGTVYHGLQLDQFTFNEQPHDYLAFLGRFSPEKGPLEAIEVARRTGKRLIMAAKINDFERDYYEQQIKPQIDGKQIVYLGEVGHRRKVELLKNARAVVLPISWTEPFGLVNIESMACGTPVITTRRGSTPELIVQGQNGFLCDSVEEMAKRVNDIGSIDRRFCRQYVEEHFSAERMARQYLELYKRLAKQPKKAM